VTTSARVLVRIGLLGVAVAAASPVRAEPWSADDAAQAAREAAGADRHQESIDAFLRARTERYRCGMAARASA
jgi:hypothetical protein